MDISSKSLLRHIIRNQHKLKRVLQQQIRSCSAAVAVQPDTSAIYDDDKNFTIRDLPATALETASRIVDHEKDVGHLFKKSDLCVRLATPSELQMKPEADVLTFGKSFTDHMLKVLWHKDLGGWQKPEITPMENLSIHPAAKVLHYAIELFEGMKAYRGVDGRIRLFRPNMNMNRMNLTAKRSGLPTFDGDQFVDCMKELISIDQEWVPHTDTASLYIRPTLIGIDPTLGIGTSQSAMLYTILSPVGSYFAKKSTESEGVSLLADPRYTRAWPGGVGDRKMGSNYGPTVQIQKEAAARGLQQVLWLYGPEHQVTEVGTMNIFMLFINENGEKELRTPPLNGLILPGITRDSILTMGQQWKTIKVTEGEITMGDVCQLVQEERLLEMFGTGTACLVSPIERINYLGSDLQIPTLEQERPLFEHIRNTLTDIQYGKVDHPWAPVID